MIHKLAVLHQLNCCHKTEVTWLLLIETGCSGKIGTQQVIGQLLKLLASIDCIFCNLDDFWFVLLTNKPRKSIRAEL